jgi:YHS domain-containing protein
MSTTGLLTEALFGTLGLLPHRSDHVITPNLHLSVVTTTLNALALVMLVAVIVIALQGRKRPASTRYAVDPICGMNVTIATASTTADIGGEQYYFCCPGCRDAFVKRSAH